MWVVLTDGGRRLNRIGDKSEAGFLLYNCRNHHFERCCCHLNIFTKETFESEVHKSLANVSSRVVECSSGLAHRRNVQPPKFEKLVAKSQQELPVNYYPPATTT